MPNGFAPIIFIAWVPLLFLENYFFENPELKKKNFFGYLYLSFLLWNVLTTWWVWNASDVGSIVAFVLNSLFMAVVFFLFYITHRKLKSNWSYIALPAYWIAFEHLHLHWEASWPWLTLGNSFATMPSLVQWYEYTGALGGSLWILSVNILVFLFLKSYFENQKSFSHKQTKKYLILSFEIILVPTIVSLIRYTTYSEKVNPVNVVATQPNIDPYGEKFSDMSNEMQLIRILQIASEKINDSTEYVLAPETALPHNIWEDEINEYSEIRMLKKYIAANPKLKMVIGAATAKAYLNGATPSVTARKFKDDDGYYDSYNTALYFENNKPIGFFHKSKLVPGVEKMPYPQIFGFLENYAIDLGGTAGSLGVQDEPSVFTSADSNIVAPVICYESVYGEYVSKYILKGAQWIAIITNDGWWGNTPGYKQHVQYARLRAIEMRRSIARSANTGISCFINQRGDIYQQTKWWEPAAISAAINKNDAITFYAKHGDYIGKLAAFVSAIFLLLFYLKKK